MFNYNIIKYDFFEAGVDFESLKLNPLLNPKFIYKGFIDNKYAGYFTICVNRKDTAIMLDTSLEKEFHGRKIARIVDAVVSEMLKEFKYVEILIDTTNTLMLKVFMDLGFIIVGNKTGKDSLYMDLLKTGGEDGK